MDFGQMNDTPILNQNLTVSSHFCYQIIVAARCTVFDSIINFFPASTNYKAPIK